jgi:hypothetical protein
VPVSTVAVTVMSPLFTMLSGLSEESVRAKMPMARAPSVPPPVTTRVPLFAMLYMPLSAPSVRA